MRPSDCCIVPPMAATPRIVLAYASVGSGHRLAAEAVARELTSIAGKTVTVDVIDALEGCDTDPAGLLDGRLAASPAGRRLLRSLSPLFAWKCRAFTAALLDPPPAAVVATHPLPAIIASRMKARGRMRAHLVVVPTDFGMPGMIVRSNVDLYCTADELVAQRVVERGLPERAIVSTGIPVRPQFTVEYDIGAARAHFGLPHDSRLVLAIAGSTEPEPYAQFKEALAVSLPALASLPDTALAIVTGQDAEYATLLRSRSKGFGTKNVHVFDYVEHMAPLIASANLVLAKPAGLVCAECVDSGVPLVLVGPARGPELANAHALVAAGAAVFAEDPRMLAEYARKVVANPRRLDRMREATLPLARPFAAADIARRTLELAGIDVAEDDRGRP